MTETPLLLRADLSCTQVRQRFTVTGVVQGVGFRPFVHRVATDLGLAGFVGNDSGAVFLEFAAETGLRRARRDPGDDRSHRHADGESNRQRDAGSQKVDGH